MLFKLLSRSSIMSNNRFMQLHYVYTPFLKMCWQWPNLIHFQIHQKKMQRQSKFIKVQNFIVTPEYIMYILLKQQFFGFFFFFQKELHSFFHSEPSITLGTPSTGRCLLKKRLQIWGCTEMWPAVSGQGLLASKVKKDKVYPLLMRLQFHFAAPSHWTTKRVGLFCLPLGRRN